MPTSIQVPVTLQQLNHVRSLMRSFVAWHRERHHEDRHLIDAYFDAGAFEEELASLPGKYAHPHGHLLLATVDGSPAGCVALRGIDSGSCEMKRMFVYPRFHGHGIGKALAEELISRARALGYSRMRLDSGRKQAEAHGLYRKLGFKDIAPYYELPEELSNWLVFMELPL